ncbi:hypothetical protein P692DRAFT_201671844, partial [Suillus brevipes Sb2]
FINTADELFGPITTIRCPGLGSKHIPWTAFSFTSADWERVEDMRIIISTDANEIQQYFSSEHQLTLWRAIPAFKELLTAWERKWDMPKYVLYKAAIEKALDKVGKYYRKMDDKPVYVLVLVLHPYYKLEYIKITWGGPEEQEQECAAGNPSARDW